MKKSIVLLSMVSVVLIVLGGYLFAIDKPTIVYPKIITKAGVPYVNPGTPGIIIQNTTHQLPYIVTPHIIPPPWYATLWPIPLAVGIVGVIYSAIRLLKK
ncbi:hypothetical protein [Acidianus manzaensis]|uniref:Uncharacterized protein n=1 Tax=Acidianus manzaensis TaxID=282676 RepID=A0A1W6K1K2_9CREN|nr:hypothetical protein [Acidianus manzaensis]ARM76431.1 hypothetical protein B6F84_10645 [Acidianus manzaensis]